jgi:hypothetical protein
MQPLNFILTEAKKKHSAIQTLLKSSEAQQFIPADSKARVFDKVDAIKLHTINEKVFRLFIFKINGQS